MSKSYEKLITLLKEMFQMDQADLDFGIYRIMNYKRTEIEKFLKDNLLPQVQEQLKNYISVKHKNLKKQIEELKKTLDETGVAYESSAKYLELKSELESGMDLEKIEDEVYSHLTDFFSRYYNNGDFISQRRYKQGVYAIPYEGEEVKLYWANADQYYIKTTEYFRDYTFTLPDGKRVHFKLVEASTDKDNNKPAENKERRFVLYQDEPMKVVNGELIIQFEYKVHDSKQKNLNDEAIKRVIELFNNSKGICSQFYGIFSPSPTEANPRRTLLEKHLNDYTARNTFDYFIHKDLGGFLRRELDFYLKNEVMFLDDLDTENEVRIEQYIAKIKVIKNIGYKIIAFLEQIENFQKKLWLKKKFVVDANYCITLDRINEEFYPEILDNRAQIEEWKKLFAIDELEGYSEPLTLEFLKANPYLVLDTAFFGEDFKERLIQSIDNVDEKTDGLLIKSENFQALNLLLNRYKEQVKCVYIDPPYNTEEDQSQGKFLFKDNFSHSSWMTMMDNRLKIGKLLMSNNGYILVSISDNENPSLRIMIDRIFGVDNFKGNLIWRKRKGGGNDSKFIAIDHEYILLYTVDTESHSKKWRIPYEEEYLKRYKEKDNIGRFYWDTLSRPGLKNPIVYDVKCPDGTVIRGEWQLSEEEFLMKQACGDIRIVKNKDGNWTIHHKVRLPEGRVFRSIINNVSNTDAANDMMNLFNEKKVFSNPKPVKLITNLISINDDYHSLVLDFFAGSGTTAHAVINLNRQDGGNRKYILVEMGEYFDTVLKPRIQKVIYSKDWKDGKPVSREGISHMFKYLKLESYEDTLNNLEIRRSDDQQMILNLNRDLKEQYILSYMLDKETEGSMSLLNIDQFTNPFGYKLKIANGLETKDTIVDLVETFNYLLGLVVTKNKAKECFNVESDETDDDPGAVKLIPAKDGSGEYTFKEVEGHTLPGDKVLIIWRTLTGDVAKDNAALDAYFKKKKYNTQGVEYDRIYVNGDNNLQNMKQDGERWKVLLIEEEFKRLMFDGTDF